MPDRPVLADGRLKRPVDEPLDVGPSRRVHPVTRYVASLRSEEVLVRNHVADGGVVAARRGEPVVLTIDAAGMHDDGHTFYLAANGVWLTDEVPPEWIT